MCSDVHVLGRPGYPARKALTPCVTMNCLTLAETIQVVMGLELQNLPRLRGKMHQSVGSHHHGTSVIQNYSPRTRDERDRLIVLKRSAFIAVPLL